MMNDLIIKQANLFQNGQTQQNVDVVVNQGKISQILPSSEINNIQATKTINANNRLLTPGLTDCHTHLVYGGNRSHEFEWRLNGETYQSIAKKGGGIRSTVAATRAADVDTLYFSARQRLESMMSQGVLQFEIKSGYGLDMETELKMLQVARQLAKDLNIIIRTTFLGAHALPESYQGRADDYINFVCQEVLPEVKKQGLADAVDVFCESIGFNLEQTRQVFETAQKLGLDIKCHAEQLTNLGGSELAAQYGALSCDHVEYIDDKAIEAMAENNVVAVLLPGAFYFLNEIQKPPVELFRQHQVPMAIATDCNPGSSPTTSLPLMMNMACVLFGLTVAEAWQAVTAHAAQALAMDNPQIQEGGKANFVLWPFHQPVDLVYTISQPQQPLVFIDGEQFHRGRAD